MRHLFTAHRTLCLALLLIAASAATASAQAGGPYQITKPTIASGTGTSAGGNYVIIGTMAQYDAVVMGGGPYLFDGGFWPEEQGFTPPACATDVTAQVRIRDGGARIKGDVDDDQVHVDHRTVRVRRTVRITNVSHNNIRGPISFVLDGLSRNVTLVNQSGITFCALPASPYVVVDLGIDGVLAPRERVTIELEFNSRNRRGIHYEARVLAGISR